MGIFGAVWEQGGNRNTLECATLFLDGMDNTNTATQGSRKGRRKEHQNLPQQNREPQKDHKNAVSLTATQDERTTERSLPICAPRRFTRSTTRLEHMKKPLWKIVRNLVFSFF